jgi:phospholipid/cholesterol/gamma-HCH transport system substrate-binding protein
MTGGIRWTAIKLLIFTIVTVIVTTWLAMIIGNFRLFSSPYEISAEFSDATGVLTGDVVKAAGVTIGRVGGIEIVDGVAVVTMTIDEGTEIPANVSAEVRFRNLVGQRMITLVPDPAGTDAALLEADDVIPLERTSPAFDLSALFNGLRPLIRSTNPEDINLVARELVKALSGREEEVEAIVGNTASLAKTLAGKDREIGILLDSINQVSGDLASRDAQLRTTLAALNDFLGDLAASKDDLNAALLTLDDAATRFNRIIEKNDENIEGELEDLAIIFDAVNDKRKDLKGAIRALPNFLVAAERVSSYGQWGNLHVIDICKDDFGTCGKRWVP